MSDLQGDHQRVKLYNNYGGAEESQNSIDFERRYMEKTVEVLKLRYKIEEAQRNLKVRPD